MTADSFVKVSATSELQPLQLRQQQSAGLHRSERLSKGELTELALGPVCWRQQAILWCNLVQQQFISAIMRISPMSNHSRNMLVAHPHIFSMVKGILTAVINYYAGPEAGALFDGFLDARFTRLMAETLGTRNAFWSGAQLRTLLQRKLLWRRFTGGAVEAAAVRGVPAVLPAESKG